MAKITGNIHYQTPKLAEFFASNRQCWDQFYPSERWVFSQIAESRDGDLGHVLDVGCAAGGLGRALREKFNIVSYTGVDISASAIEAGRKLGGLPDSDNLLVADILDAKDVGHSQFDIVISLSCADWNVETQSIIKRCWDLVQPGGRFVMSLRLCPGRSLTRMAESYQYLSFTDVVNETTDEKAPYVVFNVVDALHRLTALPDLTDILAYGYWGPVSATARTKIDRAVFTVLALTKRDSQKTAATNTPRLDLRWPGDLWTPS